MAGAGLTDLQAATLRLFFTLPESRGFVLAGGGALLAQRLIDRPTDDLDFFTAQQPDAVAKASQALADAAAQRGWKTAVIQAVSTFCRMHLTGMDDEILVDLAVDAPPRLPTVATAVGPAFDPLELAGQKLLALFGRAEPRDFADVHLLAERFGRSELLRRAADIDPGFDPAVLASMMRMLERLDDTELPLAAEAVPRLREYFGDWASQLEAE
ncbi:nucleotidyl transferase AbiEii/AbiGii toxin family protein [Glycomyces paridis]|uniref:nucleotidyl transferase AbiEii/AbiGii toxin family protein n=1 Tax=Glycomyces paridis TaxID=2126555 RepID=UPI00130539A5|nr:nucleotidyl transferase AbiEii/AbiGii toxin family protein [Glycomyces paridis]